MSTALNSQLATQQLQSSVTMSQQMQSSLNMTVVSLENKLTEVRKEVVTNRRLFQNEIVGLKEELCEVQKQYRRISVKQDQLFLKQDQIQCTLQSDTVTPPIRSPSMLEQASWCKQPHHFTPENQASVSAGASTSYGDLSSGIGDWDLDTMLQDFDFTGMIMTPAGLQVEDDRLVHESPIADGNHPDGSTAFCKKNRGSAIGAVYKQSTDSAQQSVVGNHPAASSMLAAVDGSYQQSTDSAQQSVVGNHPAASSMLAAVDGSYPSSTPVDRNHPASTAVEENRPAALLAHAASGNHPAVSSAHAVSGSHPASSLQLDIKRGMEIAKAQRKLHSEDKLGK